MLSPSLVIKLVALGLCLGSGLLSAQVPSTVPPNISSVTATVLSRKTWPAGSLQESRPALAADRIYYSAGLKILTVAPATEGRTSHAEIGQTIEAFATQEIPASAVGQKISGTVELIGDTRGVRWMLRSFQLHP